MFNVVLGGIKVQDKLPVYFKLNLLFRNLSHTWFTDFFVFKICTIFIHFKAVSTQPFSWDFNPASHISHICFIQE